MHFFSSKLKGKYTIIDNRIGFTFLNPIPSEITKHLEDGNRDTQSHQIPFQDCWSVSVIHKLPDTTPDHIHRQFETEYQLVLQSRHDPGLNIH